MPKNKEIVDLENDYIKTLEEGHDKLLQKYNIILLTMGKIRDGLKKIQDTISDALSEVLKS
ncbi:hypothetical protein LCGC14_1270920 [marine sediment metagenome]|uniref:Uncharacterized protein n=1 Tax=marine sediment metagenome TaxID=412755 RepID=A0A0F9KY70_9ZZZZ